MLQRLISADDEFNPNNWGLDQEPHRLYLDKHCTIWAYLDYDDYQWAIQWRWSFKQWPRAKIPYAYRTHNDRGIRWSEYLHISILERSGLSRPTVKHTMGDHRDGNSLDCRKANLRWVTPAMNSRNRKNFDVYRVMSNGEVR